MNKNSAPKKAPAEAPDLTQEPLEIEAGGSPGDQALTLPGEDHNPGRGKYRRQLERFAKLPDQDKHSLLRDTWKEVAMGAAFRAKQFVATCSPKDFGRLYQLIMSGAVSIDKAFPPKEQHNAPAFVFNLFGSLGQRASAIAQPESPVIDVKPQEEAWPSSALTKKPEPSLPTSTETLSTTTPSPSS